MKNGVHLVVSIWRVTWWKRENLDWNLNAHQDGRFIFEFGYVKTSKGSFLCILINQSLAGWICYPAFFSRNRIPLHFTTSFQQRRFVGTKLSMQKTREERKKENSVIFSSTWEIEFSGYDWECSYKVKYWNIKPPENWQTQCFIYLVHFGRIYSNSFT